jgi:predicted GIY-YIG superfamily endonuclease
MFIYTLVSGQLILYIGKTVNLERRRCKHRSKFNTTSSRHIPSYIDWEIKLLEECSTDASNLREQYWIDELKPFYNEVKAYNHLSQIERVKEYQATEEYKKKISTEEYRAYNREAQRKHQAKKRAAFGNK